MKKNKQLESITDYVFSKVPPQAPALEEAVLGALMLDRDAMSVVLDIIKTDSFYIEAHQLIYKSMLRLFERSQPIDLLTVMESLKKSGDLDRIGGPAYLASLTNKVASAVNIEFHARIIYQKCMRRQIISVAADLTSKAFDDTSADSALIDDAERALFRITGDMAGQNIKDAGYISGNLARNRDKILNQPEGLVGVPCGLSSIDKFTNGFQHPDFWIIAARPGMGKSAIVTSFARQQAVFRNIPVGIFSLEMSAEQQQRRIAAAEANIANQICSDPRQMDAYQLHAYNTALERIGDSPIYYNDTSGISMGQLKSQARTMVRRYGVKIIYIDYLQLMSAELEDRSGNREQEISYISRSLKALAGELEVPIIALSQLSRAVETRGGIKRPQLSDLRESGSLEQDADNVVFLYRPEYYGINTDENGRSLEGICEFILAKHRNGALTTVPIHFNKSRVLFSDLKDFNFQYDPF